MSSRNPDDSDPRERSTARESSMAIVDSLKESGEPSDSTWKLISRRYDSTIRRVARSKRLPECHTDDVKQEVEIALYKKITTDSIQLAKQGLRNLIAQFACYKAIDLIRRENRINQMHSNLVTSTDQPIDAVFRAQFQENISRAADLILRKNSKPKSYRIYEARVQLQWSRKAVSLSLIHI